jgi:hypothetical protein
MEDNFSAFDIDLNSSYLGSRSRRSSLKYGGLLFASSLTLSSHNSAIGQSKFRFRGCCLLEGGQAFITRLRVAGFLGLPGIAAGIDRSGNDRFDRSLGVVLADLAVKFQVRPGFFYFNDVDAPNAFAVNFSLYPATQGTVGFGLTMLRNALQLGPEGEMFVMGICAHEFAHIHQMYSQVQEKFTRVHAKYQELHADFLAGYFVGLGRSYSPRELVTLGRAWEQIGGSASHGTSDERLSAIEEGYKLARVRSNIGIAQATLQGIRYLNLS